MRKCGPLSEGFSTRTSLALALRARVRTVPVKPLPVEVKVPMVAIVVSFQFLPGRAHRDLDGWRQTGGDRPAPRKGPARSKGQPGRDFLVLARGMDAQRPGEESRNRLLRRQSETARSDDGLRSDRPNR